MQFAQIPDQSEWNDDVPYASAFDGGGDEEDPRNDGADQEEPKKKKERSFSGDKKKALLGDDLPRVRGTAVKRCCCHPLTICISTLLVIILICGGVISGFIVADQIEKANAVKTPCTGKQTGNSCTMEDTKADGICKLDDNKFINDGELICDDVTIYEEACEQKSSDDMCVVADRAPGKCMYTSSTSKILWCNIPSKAELACIDTDTTPKESGTSCQISVGEDVEKGTCEVVIYSRRKQCIIPDPDEEICASLERADTCKTSSGKKGTCEQMMDNQLKCVEPAPGVVDLRIVAVALVGGGIILLGVITFIIFCYCRQIKN